MLKILRKLREQFSRTRSSSLSPADFWNRRYSTDEFIFTKVENRFVKELCQGLTPGKAIDVGGGEGRNTVWLASLGWQVENIDISEVGLQKSRELAKEFGVDNLCVETIGGATDFVSKLAPVDLAVIAYLQIPQPQLVAAVAHCAEMLNTGGNLCGVWHSRNNLEEGFGGPQNPELLPTVEELRLALESLPLEINILEIRDGQVQTKDGLKPSKTLVLFATKN